MIGPAGDGTRFGAQFAKVVRVCESPAARAMRAAALLAASLSSAAAAKIPDFASKPHIVMVREPRAAGLRSCLRFTARARPAARPALLTLGALVDPA